MDNLVPTPVTLTADELKTVIKLVSLRGKEYGAARICRQLSGTHSVPTGDLSQGTDVANISDLVLRCINPRIAELDLYVACEKPPYTSVPQWSFYKDTAANDLDWSAFDQRLGNKLAKEIEPLDSLAIPEVSDYLQRLDAMSAGGNK